MRFYIETDYDYPMWEIVPEDGANEHKKRWGLMYVLDEELVTRYVALREELEEIEASIEEAVNAQEGERGSLYEPPAPFGEPKISMYQLRRTDTGTVLVELTTPEGAAWSWLPEIPIEEEVQWWEKHGGDEDFSPRDLPFTYGDPLVVMIERAK